MFELVCNGGHSSNTALTFIFSTGLQGFTSLLPLTDDTDEGVCQQVAVLVGGVALVNSTASHLHRVEDDGVTQNLSAQVRKSTWGHTDKNKCLYYLMNCDDDLCRYR